MSGTRYTVGFLGRRDAYQVPQAIAEADLLGSFVTGAYRDSVPPFLRKTISGGLQARLDSRYAPGIPKSRIEAHWEIEATQYLSRLFRDSSNRSWTWANCSLSRAIRDRARKFRENILTYEPYGWEAFNADYDHNPRKVLFHFHLHPFFERDLIANDSIDHPCGPIPWTMLDARAEWDSRVVDLWKLADQVICASSFTRQTLLAQGMQESQCAVVPYGVNLPGNSIGIPESEGFSVLFVGSAVQRKGLHHLLRAWSSASLPPHSKLTIVSRVVDPAIEGLLASTPRIEVRRGVSSKELSYLFRNSHLFAMPSILEGFGQVFLEALSHGCPVLGTPNTCLPDLGDESSGVYLNPVGEIEMLSQRLESLCDILTSRDASGLREEARKVSEKFSWERFRRQLANTVVDASI